MKIIIACNFKFDIKMSQFEISHRLQCRNRKLVFFFLHNTNFSFIGEPLTYRKKVIYNLLILSAYVCRSALEAMDSAAGELCFALTLVPLCGQSGLKPT